MKRYSTEIVARDVVFLGGGERSSGERSESSSSGQQSSAPPASGEPEDIPF